MPPGGAKMMRVALPERAPDAQMLHSRQTDPVLPEKRLSRKLPMRIEPAAMLQEPRQMLTPSRSREPAPLQSQHSTVHCCVAGPSLLRIWPPRLRHGPVSHHSAILLSSRARSSLPSGLRMLRTERYSHHCGGFMRQRKLVLMRRRRKMRSGGRQSQHLLRDLQHRSGFSQQSWAR